MAEHHRAQHHVLGQDGGFGFDHQHRIGGTGHDQLQLRFLQLAGSRVEDVLAVPVADLGGADRAHERGAGQGQGGGGADQGRDVTVDFRIQRHHRGDDLDFVLVVFRKQRADRAIDQARDQGFLLGRAAFALEEATGDAAAGVELLLVVDRQREEVLAFAGGLGGDGADQQYGVVHLDDDGAAGLAGDFAGFQGDGVLAVLEGFGDFCHVVSLDIACSDSGPPAALAVGGWPEYPAGVLRGRHMPFRDMPRGFLPSNANRGALLRRGGVLHQRRRPSFSIRLL